MDLPAHVGVRAVPRHVAGMAMTSAATTLPVDELAPRRHRWDREQVKYLAHIECSDGNSRTLTPCLQCEMVKVTVIPPHGFPWHEWRTRAGSVWVGEATPPCIPQVPA
jgi:hypothetical protein